MKKVDKKWGSELWIVNNDKYCGKLLIVEPNHTCSMHFHKDKTETFFIIRGRLLLTIMNLTDASTQDITWNNYYWGFDENPSTDVSQIDFPNAGMTGDIIAQDWSWEIWFIS